jgi:HTH-type transcriptional regulator/antitoxin HigA
MEIETIRTELEYSQAMTRLEKIFDAKRNTHEGDELEALGKLIEKYEDEYFPIRLSEPLPPNT